MKIPGTCILIEAHKFPVLDDEDDALINEGTYGKALCLYLEQALPKSGLAVPSFCCEDWGWWVAVKSATVEMGLCVYSDPEQGRSPTRYAIMSSITDGRKWVWSKFRAIDLSPDVTRVMDSVERLFDEDGDVTRVSRHDDYPF